MDSSRHGLIGVKHVTNPKTGRTFCGREPRITPAPGHFNNCPQCRDRYYAAQALKQAKDRLRRLRIKKLKKLGPQGIL